MRSRTAIYRKKGIVRRALSLGYKRIKKTPLVYTDLEKVCFPNVSDGYYAKVARMEKEICGLVDSVRSHSTQEVNQT